MNIPGRLPRPATCDDLLALPAHVVGEIIDGELHATPRPTPRHALAASVLGGEIGPPFHGGRGGPGGWWILFEPELHFDGDVLVPDLAGWRRSRMPSIPDTAYLTLAPDWVCEVISPGTGRLDRLTKAPVYAREGVGHLWMIDPLQRTLEVMRLDQGRWLILGVHGESAVVRAEPFDAIDLSLGLLWADGSEPSAN